jgi:1-acyl-sn-glycerol-3-phosphate acyltransferase
MAQRLGVDIVPIGCSGSNHCYPGAIPWARRGRIVYRIGEPIQLDSPEFKPFRVTDPFVPFSDAARQAHGQSFQALTDRLMNRINDLIDPEYKRDENQNSSSEVNRFL